MRGHLASDIATVGMIAVVLCAGCGKKTGETLHPDAGAPPPKAAKVRVVAPGDAPADLARSQVQVSVIKDKDSKSPVVGKLALSDGAVSLSSPTPSARISVDLDTFDSGVPIRNERVRNIFFETSGIGWDTMEIVVPAIPPAVVSALRSEHHAEQVKLDATLRVHGRTVMSVLTVDATYADDGRLTVKTSTPAQLKISDFALADNLHRLSAICMHDSIDDVVLVEATLEFAAPK
jgi:hypothetical protein